jgi:hypothetical protein
VPACAVAADVPKVKQNERTAVTKSETGTRLFFFIIENPFQIREFEVFYGSDNY